MLGKALLQTWLGDAFLLLADGPVVGLPAVLIQPQLAHTLSGFDVRLQVFVGILPCVTCFARRAHQILGWCWQRR
ncbi:hypothetical protein KPLM21_380007 [Klebsiella pneumoniae]|nr:hypothetical protein KPLM21_380007 [Klebsiella pneumoniae]